MRVVVLHFDPDLGPALIGRLREEGHDVECRTELDPGKIAFEPGEHLAMILDARSTAGMIPWVLQRLRERSDKALLVVLGGGNRLDERIRAFESGADEYLAEPIALDELAVRLKALDRRAGGSARGPLMVNGVGLDAVRRAATRGGTLVALTPREYIVLSVLMASAGELVTRPQLEQQLYGVASKVGSNRIEVHIHNLRRKLGESFIRNVRGRGYRVGGL